MQSFDPFKPTELPHRPTYWTCSCGSKIFKLLMHGSDLAAECVNCGHVYEGPKPSRKEQP